MSNGLGYSAEVLQELNSKVQATRLALGPIIPLERQETPPNPVFDWCRGGRNCHISQHFSIKEGVLEASDPIAVTEDGDQCIGCMIPRFRNGGQKHTSYLRIPGADWDTRFSKT